MPPLTTRAAAPAAALAALLLAPAALAEAHMAGPSAAMDADGDGMVSEREFDTDLADRVYESGDADGDGMLSRDEFRASFYATYDMDGSAMLEHQEMELIDADFGPGGRYAPDNIEAGGD
jgi:hypothetical protein